MGINRWAVFAGGVLFGTAGLKILSSREAKQVYTHTAAAVLRGKDYVMENYDKVCEEYSDIIADAKEMNENYKASEIIADASGSEVLIPDGAEDGDFTEE